MEQRAERPVDHPVVPVLHVGVGPHDDVAGRLVERLPERLALADERAVARQDVGMLDDARALGLGDLAGPVRRRRVDDEDLVEQRHATDHLAHRPRTIGPIVSSSLSVGRTRLIVRFCFSLSVTSRRRSANSAWWKFDSPNQRSTRTGTARASSAARSAAARVSARAASWSNVVRSMVSRVLTTMTVGLARAAIASGRAPNRYVSPSAPPGDAEAPMTTRSAFSASRRIALRTFGRLAQDGLARDP